MYCLTIYVSFEGNYDISLIFLVAILFYANYLKLPKSESEPTKIFFNLDKWANKLYLNKNLRPQNKVIENIHSCLPYYISCMPKFSSVSISDF